MIEFVETVKKAYNCHGIIGFDKIEKLELDLVVISVGLDIICFCPCFFVVMVQMIVSHSSEKEPNLCPLAP